MSDNADDTSHQAIGGKAVAYKAKGGYEVIEVIERAVRPPAAGEVRIAVKAAAVNPSDILLRESGFRSGFGGQTYPIVPGLDAAGLIEAVGPGVSRLHVGQQVMACVGVTRPEGGAQAQHVVVPAASVVAIPDGASLAQACTLPMNGLTALRALELAELQDGQFLAVSGGAGLAAHYAIAIAKRKGLRVIADARLEEADLVRSYGADVVIGRGPDFADAVRREVPQGVDALLDTAVLGEKSFGAVRDGGTYVPFRFWQDQPSERGIAIKPVSVFAVFDRADRTEWLEFLCGMVAAAEITLRIAGEYEPERSADAHRALQAGGLRGRPVILF